jgi:hypothetical protein
MEVQNLSFDAALDRVINYLVQSDEQEHYEDNDRPANHVWRAVEVLMRHRALNAAGPSFANDC